MPLSLGLGLGLSHGQGGSSIPINALLDDDGVTALTDDDGAVLTDDEIIALHFLGDSMLDDGLLRDEVVNYLSQDHAVTQDGVGGSTLIQQLARYEATPQYHESALISVDALGVSEGDVDEVDSLVALQSTDQFIYVRGSIFSSLVLGSESRVTLEAVWGDIESGYPDDYVGVIADVGQYGTGSAFDEADITNGIWPRSYRGDGVHINAVGRPLFAAIIARKIIDKGWDGVQAPANIYAPVISRSGDTLSAYDGIWHGCPTPLFTYQWNLDGSPVVDETSDMLDVSGAGSDEQYSVTVTGTNGYGSDSATSAHVWVNRTAESSYSTETNDFINALYGDRPNGTQATAINTAMARVQALAAKLDWFCAPLRTEEASLRNWLAPTEYGTAVGTAAFVAGTGWSFPASGDKVRTLLIPSVDATDWTLSSAHFGIEIRTFPGGSPSSEGVLFAPDGRVLYRPAQSGSSNFFRLNGLDFGSVSVSDPTGHHAVSRDGTTVEVFVDGVSQGTATVGADDVPTLDVELGTDQLFSGVLSGWHFGGDITEADAAELADIFSDLSAVDWAA